VARSRRQRILIAFATVVAAVLVAVGTLLLYATHVDLGHHRERVERLVSQATGYTLEIGDLHVDLDLRGASTLEARDVTLTNPGFEPEPRLVALDHLVLEIELWPLLENRIHVHDAKLNGGEVLVRGDPDHGVNWVPVRDTSRRPRSGPVRVPAIIVDRAVITSVTTTVDLPGLPRPLTIDADQLEASTDPTDMVRLELEGTLNGEPLAAEGAIGPLAGIIVAGEIRPDLEIRLAGATASATGRISDLTHLTGIDLQVHGAGPDIDRITDVFGLPSLEGGEFSLTAVLTPAVDGTRIDADVALGTLAAWIDGSIDSLIRPSLVDVTVAASGPDLAAAAALAGLHGAPHDSFDLRGGIRWAGFPVTFDAVDVRVGSNTLTIDGTLGAPPALSGSEIDLTGGGPDMSALLSLAGIRFPAVPYRIDGRLRRLDEGVAIEEFDAEVGADRLTITGRVGEWPGLEGTDLEVRASGPSLEPYRAFAGVDLPADPYELAAEVVPTSRGIRIATTAMRVGSAAGSVVGEIVTEGGLSGTRLQVDIAGDDLTELHWAHGLDGLPSTSFRVAGTVELASRRLRLDGVRGRVGDVELDVDGSLVLAAGTVGSKLDLMAAGPDASWVMDLFGLDKVPAWPFQVAGTVGVTESGITIDDVAVALGDLTGHATGLVTSRERRVGSRLRIDLSGPRLADIETMLGMTGLPESSFSLTGTVHAEPDGYRLDDTVTIVGPNRLTVDGILATSPDFVGTSLELELGGPDLASLGRLIAGWTDLPDLPPEPYTVSTSVIVDPTGYDIQDLVVTLGDAHATVSGRLGRPPELIGTDLTIQSRGPNASLVTAVTGVSVPVAPFNVDGRVERTTDGYRFSDLRVRLADYHLRLDGALGEPPRFVGSDLRVAADGPSLALLAQLSRIGDLPDLSYQVNGHVLGSPRRFRIDDLDVTLGRSDVRGTLSLDLEARPRLRVDLESDMVDLGQLARDRADRIQANANDGGPFQPQPLGRVFSDEPFEFELLNRLDAGIFWRVSTLRSLSTSASDVDLAVSLEDGRLTVGPVDAVGEHGGRLHGRLLLEPAADGHRIELQLALRGAKADLTNRGRGSGRDPTMADLVVDLDGHGRTPHEAASRANGDVIVSLAGGEVDSSIVDMIGADIIVSILDALNPFTGAGSETVGLECAVFVVDVNDGQVLAEPIAIKTDNVTVVGHGAIDLDTEDLDFEWVTKPRKGFGVSASTLTNPYVKLGGTLAEPALEVKPAQAMISTGVAVATAGLSLLGKGLYDRVTSEGKVCEKALEEAQRRLRGEAPRRRSKLFR